jgi:L-lactate dehydrogenase (cytochrome)
MTVINSIADLRALAQRRLPRALYDYIERGSYDELTWTRNRDDFRTIQLRQRVMVDVSGLDTATTVLGESWKMPLAPAPTGLTGLFWRDGEIHAARAARHAGVPFCLSTMSICPIEDVRAGFDGTLWFQLYVMRDRTFTGMLMTRALEARCPVLVVTLDLPLQALRRRDPKNGLAVPPRLTWASARDFVRRPGWVFGVLRSRRRTFGNLATFFPRKGTAALSEWMGSQLGPLTAQDLAWVRERWPASWYSRASLKLPTRARPWTSAPTPSSCPTTAAGNSTAALRPSPHCRGSSMPWRGDAKCCWMAVSVVARMYSGRWRWAQTPVSPAGVISTVSRPAGKPA